VTDENALVGTDCPVDIDGCVNGSLDVCTVEVGLWRSGGFVAKLGWEAQDIPQQRTLAVDLVNVEARVDVKCSSVDHVKDIAGRASRAILWCLNAWRRELEISIDIVGVTTALVKTLELGEEGAIEVEHVVVRHRIWYSNGCLLGVGKVTNARVIRERSAEVEILGVILIQHGGRDVRDVSTCVRLASDVDLVVLDAEQLLKVFEEFDKVLGSLLLGGGSWGTDGEAGADGLLDPEYC